MPGFGVLMALAVLLIAAVAYWDARRESGAALSEFGEEQATLSAALATVAASSADRKDLSTRFAALERPGELRVFWHSPGGDAFAACDGTELRSLVMLRAFERAERWVRLERADAAALGLPARAAVAGLAEARTATGQRLDIAVVSSAASLRDRERRAVLRLLSSVLAGSSLVVGFGLAALRRQRRQLELARELAVAEIARQGEDRLARADKLATLGALATGVAHEVSTPLGVIRLRAEQLSKEARENPRSERAVKTIQEQVDRISGVIRGFLSLARGESPILTHVPPQSLAREALALVEHRYEHAGVRLTSKIAEGLPNVACDSRLFEQVLVNVLLNACDACARGGHVELALKSDGGDVTFAISDDGVGITEEARLRATEPFFTTKAVGAGTGLGLAIANEIVKHHNGTLGIAANLSGGGTRVLITLPAASEEQP